MNYEKAYREALERAKTIDKHEYGDIISTIFPELAESEDNKLIEEIIYIIKQYRESLITEGRHRFDDCIAWLEKQANKEKDKRYEYLEELIAANDIYQMSVNEEMIKNAKAKVIDTLDKLHLLELLGIEKENEQKSIDNVKPKFNVGDWIVSKYMHHVMLILNNDNGSYKTVETNGTERNDSYDFIECNFKLWTIQDAKDGDVVVDKSDGTIGIFQSIGHHPDGGSFNDPSYCFLHCRYDDGYFFADFEDGNIMDSYDVIPAIKEQSDILFTEMRDAEYEWDAEKKKLKKIEEDGVEYKKHITSELVNLAITGVKQKSESAWSEEDEKMFRSLSNALARISSNTRTDSTSVNYTFFAEIDWLKSLKNRVKPQSKELDENCGIDGLWHAINILERTLGKVDGYQTDDGILEHKCAIETLKKLYDKK